MLSLYFGISGIHHVLVLEILPGPVHVGLVLWHT